MQLVIIAGGKGTRLKDVSGDLPKPMVDIGGKPLLEHQVRLGKKHGIHDILLLTGYGSHFIERHFGDGAPWDVKIRYREEPQPLGTAGALLDAFDLLEERFLVLYGDAMLNVDLTRLLGAHRNGAATLFLHPNDHPQDSDLVELNAADEVTALHLYPHAPGSCFPNLVNAALYVFTKESLRAVEQRWRVEPKAIDICKHLFPALLAEGATLHGYRSREYIKDAGTPARLEEVRRHYRNGRIAAGSLETPAAAIFLDRDGTLNYDRGWIDSPKKMDLLAGAAEAVHAINEAGYLAVVVTNQPVIARGECSEAGMQKIHDKFEWLLGEAHAYVDAIYYCPHHPHSGFPGERKDLKIACTCRKPAPGLIERAIRDLNVDGSRSWIVGDSESDVKAGVNAGIKSALVRCNQEAFKNLPDCESDFSADTVLEAVEHILKAGAD